MMKSTKIGEKCPPGKGLNPPPRHFGSKTAETDKAKDRVVVGPSIPRAIIRGKFPSALGGLRQGGPVKGLEEAVEDELPGAKAQKKEERQVTTTGENHVRFLRTRLMDERQSYANAASACESPEAAAISLGPDATAALDRQILDAIKTKRIFSIFGYFPIISEELKKRSWIEKKDPEKEPLNYEYLITTLSLTNTSGTPNIESPPSLIPTAESLAMDVIKNVYIWPKIKDATPNYVFTRKRNFTGHDTVGNTATLSQLSHLFFCTKAELARTVKAISKKIIMKFPRAYVMSDTATKNDFVEDYRLTAVLGSLKKILDSKSSRKKIFNANGTIPYEMVDFVEQRCWEFLNAYGTEYDANSSTLWFKKIFNDTWNKFLVWYYEIVEESATVRLSNSFQINDIYERFECLARKIIPLCPQFFIDGHTNMWIIKPTNSSSGLGVKLERRLNDILTFVSGSNKCKETYIIQKYIEIPLRIFNVKVDLRQYVLITNTQPTQIWMYKEGYVRFCSKTYSVKDFSETIHLSNVRVQSKYRENKALGVPEECMWDFEQFKTYLKSINQDKKWTTSIYPTICETILTIVLESYKPNVYQQPSSFQLLGADFILTDNFEPWLIEINNNPGLNPTTSIITKISTALLEDLVKVTVDFPLNANTDTGLFENIYTEKCVKPVHAKKINTKEYYYQRPAKNTKQL